MDDDTNPHKLVAQYVKARKIATVAFSHDITQLDPTPAARASWKDEAQLASVPSPAVMLLAQTLLDETYDLARQFEAARDEGIARVLDRVS